MLKQVTSKKGKVYFYDRERYTHLIADRKCPKCEKLFPLNENFFRERKSHQGGFYRVCRICQDASVGDPRSRRERDRERERQFNGWGFPKAKRDTMLAAQPWCMICLSTKNLMLDHCHTTEMPRAVLCNECNSGLGKFKDNPTLLKAAIAYLEWFKELHTLPYYRDYWNCK